MPKGFVTPLRLSRVLDMPISMAQTELRANKTIEVATVPLALGQSLYLQSLTVHVLKILNPGQVPQMNNVALGICSASWLFGKMLTGAMGYTVVTSVGSSTTNLFARLRAATPGIYRIVCSNNTANLDLSVVVTGSVKIYL